MVRTVLWSSIVLLLSLTIVSCGAAAAGPDDGGVAAAAVAAPDAGAAGVRCIVGENGCGAHLFCEAADHTCSAGIAGTCVSAPSFCPRIYKPVCGCDGRTYLNGCWRRAARVSSARGGFCLQPG